MTTFTSPASPDLPHGHPTGAGLTEVELTKVELTEVELTMDGYVRLSAETARAWFPEDALVALRRGNELWLLPLVGPQSGGLLLKQRNRAGDRSALVAEVFGDADLPAGRHPACWDEASGALRVDLGGA